MGSDQRAETEAHLHDQQEQERDRAISSSGTPVRTTPQLRLPLKPLRLRQCSKLQVLMENLNPIPFIPHWIPFIGKHEKLLRKLGLWDFVNMDFDRNIRLDLLAQLIATYRPKLHGSYVNGFRIKVSGSELARAFNIPVNKNNNNNKKKKMKKGERVKDGEVYSEDSIEFLVNLVSAWMLLHDDVSWLMPNEMRNWLNLIKRGYPEKVDWGGLLWFMVKKELTHGVHLRDCYYASHLQHLMKRQHHELFVNAASVVVKEDEFHQVNNFEKNLDGKEGCVVGDKKEGKSEYVENLDIGKCIKKDGDSVSEGEKHALQCCSTGDGKAKAAVTSLEEKPMMMEQEDDDEDGCGFHVLSTMEGSKSPSNSSLCGQFLSPSSTGHKGTDLPCIASKRRAMTEHYDGDDDLSPTLHHGNKKQIRINNFSDMMAVDFGKCMDQIRKVTGYAKAFYEEKQVDMELKTKNLEILYKQMQGRNAVLKDLEKIKFQEIEKRNFKIFRLERELLFMNSVLNGYRVSLKETRKAFSEYRRRAQMDAGPTHDEHEAEKSDV